MIPLGTSKQCFLFLCWLLSLTTISISQTPDIPIITGPTFILDGNSVTLTCTSTGGNPAPTVYWYRVNKLLDTTYNTTNGVTTNSFTFVANGSHHIAVFECRVNSSELESYLSATWYFQVYIEPNQPTLTGPQTLLTGNIYQWTCISTGGNPAPTMTMRIGNIHFSTGITQSSVMQSDSTHTVTASLSWNPSISNNGQTLYCDVQHSQTRGNNLQTVSLQLTVNDPLSVNAPQTQYQQNVGNLVVMNCVITGTATSITWYFNNQVINIASSSKYSNGNTINPSLTISNVALSDAGLYICQATNGLTTVNSLTITLTVLDIPSVTIQQSLYNVNYGSSVMLVCSVTANPVHTTVYWRKIKNGVTTDINVANSNNKYSGSTVNNPSLQINNADLNDEANYACFASNSVGTGQSSQTFLDVIGGLLTVTIPQSSYSVLIGQQVTVSCTVIGTPTQTNVFWRKVVNGVQTNVDINGNSRYSGGTTSSPSLTISNTQRSDEGIYVCYATNIVGTSNSQNTFLEVTGDIPSVNIQQSLYNVNYGSSVMLVCSVTANPVHTTVYWRKIKNGVTTDINVANSNNKYSGSTVNNPSLQINNADLNDEANYACFASNSVGTGQSSQTFLDVIGGLLTVTIPQSSYSVLIGQQVTVSCTVIGTPTQTSVFWRKVVNGVQTNVDINGNSRFTGGTASSPSLTISNTQRSDEGIYVCYATNIVGTSNSQNTFLEVTGGVPIVQISFLRYEVNFSSSITLGCSVVSNPALLQVYWRKTLGGTTSNIDVTNSGGKYSGSTLLIPSLTINNAALSDEANYTCYATNSVGTGQSATTSLDVVGNFLTVSVPQSSYSVLIGQQVTILCIVTGTPTQTSVFWRKVVNGVQTNVDINGNSRYSGGTTSSPSLTITNTQRSDEGIYLCYATNIVGTSNGQNTFLDVTGDIPTVTIQQQNYNVNFGNSTVLVCSVIANPTHTTVYWRKIKNGVTTDINVANSNNKYSGSTVNNPSLQINNADLNDDGHYICFASNSIGTGQSTSAFLDVFGDIPVVTIHSNMYSVLLRSSVTIQCTVSSNPSHTSVTWQRTVNGVLTTVTVDGSRMIGSTVETPSLTISNAVSGDEGNYICTATNVVGTGTSQQTLLVVTGNIPTVTVGQNQYSSTFGQTVTMVCTVQANPTETSVYWRKLVNGQMTNIDMNNMRYTGSTVGSPSLAITALELSDEGYYQCYAQNSVGTGSSQQTFLDVIGNIPVVTTPTTSYTITIGDSVTFTCNVTANPQHSSVYWQYISSGSSTSVNIDGRFSGSSTSSPSLTISNAQLSDQGTYVCYATNSVGTGQSTEVVMVVTGNVPNVSFTQTSFTGNYGDTITLGCTVSANPGVTSVYWQKVSGSITSTVDMSNSRYTGSSVSTPSLTITNLNSNDDGNYICLAANSIGTGQSIQGPLTVIGDVPVVTLRQLTYSTNIGNTITLACVVSANPAHTAVYWTRQNNNGNTETLNPASSTKYSGSTTQSASLTINNVDTSDEGNYICHATNAVGTGQSSQTNLGVIGNAPTSIAIIPSPITVNEGQTVTAICTTQGSPTITYTWFKDNTNSQLSTGSILQITSSTRTDAGTYLCRASNAYGNADAAVTLDVQYVPDVTTTQPAQIVEEQTVTIQYSYVFKMYICLYRFARCYYYTTVSSISRTDCYDTVFLRF
ncbi:basement membrane-specific heparan sulfate proteoglycan core protein-like isoform X2 [Mytilus edulis]|uniref:basement membrane-specific heparan sulfate proteoglycan core protein-like isoform X2 n=1 Tax=Mytilus edulis TaxID=6550 RepID=UPI0039EE5996